MILHNQAMRSIILFAASIILFVATPSISYSQESNQIFPSWAPSKGYKENVKHIYFPEQNLYFDLDKKLYIYLLTGQWQIAEKLPELLNTYDLNKARKERLEEDTDSPHKNNAHHLVEYRKRRE